MVERTHLTTVFMCASRCSQAPAQLVTPCATGDRKLRRCMGTRPYVGMYGAQCKYTSILPPSNEQYITIPKRCMYDATVNIENCRLFYIHIPTGSCMYPGGWERERGWVMSFRILTQDQEKEELAQICDDLMKELRNRDWLLVFTVICIVSVTLHVHVLSMLCPNSVVLPWHIMMSQSCLHSYITFLFA